MLPNNKLGLKFLLKKKKKTRSHFLLFELCKTAKLFQLGTDIHEAENPTYLQPELMMNVLYSLVLGIYGNYTAPYTHNSFLLILWILTSQFCIHLFHTKSVFVSSTVKYNLVFTDCPILNGIEERVKKKKNKNW